MESMVQRHREDGIITQVISSLLLQMARVPCGKVFSMSV
jgi:hypothetical protein